MKQNHQTQKHFEAGKNPKSASESDCLRASDELKLSKNTIIELWEKRVREQILAAQGKTSINITNSLGVFLDELVIILAQNKSTSKILSEDGMSELHGRQRASFSGYFLPQLLKEFSVLREVIIEVLNDKEVLTYDVQRLINKSIDSVISLAATEFSQVQQASIKVALTKAEISNRDLEHFAAIAAHDLKSPLATIYGYLNILNDEFKGKLGESELKYIQIMKKASERMLHLIDRLLDYARLSKMDKLFQPTNVNDVIEVCLQNLADTVIKMKAKVTYPAMPTVMGDINLLTQLFQNLIANAIKFHGDALPNIQIEIEDKNDMWLFSVRDNGIGFDPEDKENIFALYKKLHGETEYQGAGIGLATCRKVVELHGGKIWADSKPGAGSTFYFTLPKRKIENETRH